MNDSLSLDLKEFECLPTKKQLTCLYQNQCETMRLVKGYKIYYRITSILGTFILGGITILFKMHMQ